MKMEIWNEEEKDEEVLRLRLVKSGDGIVLRSVDENGELFKCGDILYINSKGEINIRHYCNAPGIRKDADGRAIVNGYKPVEESRLTEKQK